MTPDIEAYAPFIQAVFDAPEEERKRIPYSIADRSMRKESQVGGYLPGHARALGTSGSPHRRSWASSKSPSVRARFGLTDADLDLIVGWVERCASGGESMNRTGSSGRPMPSGKTPGEAGLERLLLGYAMPGKDENLFAGILPYDHIEGSEVAVLGSFVEFVGQLFQFVQPLLNTPRTLTRWSEHLLNALSRFFPADEDAMRELQAVRQVLADLETIQELSGFDEAIEPKGHQVASGKASGTGRLRPRLHHRRGHLLLHAAHAEHSRSR